MDLLGDNLITLEYESNYVLLPKFRVNEEVLEELKGQWEDTIIIKLFGRDIKYKVMFSKLKTIWKLHGGLELVDLGHGYFLVRLYLASNLHWDPNFIPSKNKILTTRAWVRFSKLNMIYYNESLLLMIAGAIGTPAKVDKNTLEASRSRFARVWVEINLSKPLVDKFILDGSWYKVEYEGLHTIYVACGCYGHLANAYPMDHVEEVPVTRENPIMQGGQKENGLAPNKIPRNKEPLIAANQSTADGLDSSEIFHENPMGKSHKERMKITRRRK
ncbi:hypothetical protein L6164_016791 [Bauhinia variegata]|uniref:Uncharacterized protein n=1 Tax=Bauhinia variegata TaxID=167791 RepID=A0ACB9N697_BAUVA|nr:hypothetical protein L6164_016791 [Bauhinia variegata]